MIPSSRFPTTYLFLGIDTPLDVVYGDITELEKSVPEGDNLERVY